MHKQAFARKRHVWSARWVQVEEGSHAEPAFNRLSNRPRRRRTPVGAENLIRRTDQGRCARKKRRYLPSDLRPAFGSTCGETRSRWRPEILVSNPIGVFGTHRLDPR